MKLKGGFIEQFSRGAIHEEVLKKLQNTNTPNAEYLADQITNKIMTNPKVVKEISKFQGRINTEGIMAAESLQHDLLDFIPGIGPALLDVIDVGEMTAASGYNTYKGLETVKNLKRQAQDIEAITKTLKGGKKKRKKRKKTRKRRKKVR
tara:strand:+ start:5102 stop:5548 length:447 start_codon:yes stop_codon:yes gene_type:complete